MSRKFGLGVIDFDITARCNLACNHCYAYSLYKSPNYCEMTTEQCLTALEKIFDPIGASFVLFYGGEPLLRSDLEIMISKVAGYGAQTGIVTNGILLTPQRLTSLVKSSIDIIGISLDAATSETYKKIRNRDVFYYVVDSIKNSVAAGIGVSIGYVINSLNASEVNQAIKLAQELGVQQIIFTQMSYEGKANIIWKDRNKIILSPEDLVDMSEKIVEGAVRGEYSLEIVNLDYATPILVDYLNKRYGVNINIPTRVCQPLTSGLFIRADGSIFPCKGVIPEMLSKNSDVFYVSRHSILEDALPEILGSDDFSKLFEMSGNDLILKGLPTICRECQFLFNKCRPCPISSMDLSLIEAEYCHDYPVSLICAEANKRSRI